MIKYYITKHYSETCLKQPLKNRQNKSFKDRWQLSVDPKYYRMLLQCFGPALSNYQAWKHIFGTSFEWLLRTGFTVCPFSGMSLSCGSEMGTQKNERAHENPLLHRLFFRLWHHFLLLDNIEKIQEQLKLSFGYFWRYYERRSICSKRANAPFSIIFSNTLIFQRRLYDGKKMMRFFTLKTCLMKMSYFRNAYVLGIWNLSLTEDPQWDPVLWWDSFCLFWFFTSHQQSFS